MIPKKPFGRTGHGSTRTLFGAAALFHATQKEADSILELLLEYGVNHIDAAASYGDAELRIGPWMKEHREEFFLATKTTERTAEAARAELHRSLERLCVDHVDMWQLHSLTDPEEWETALGPGGVLEAAVQAREEGLIRFIGVTGHGHQAAAMHLRSLERFDFDAVLLPYNFSIMRDPAYAADFERLVKVCQERKVAVQTIKSIARRPWDDREKLRATWYEPFEDQRDIDTAVHWVLARPELFLNTVGDMGLLPRVLEAASRLPVGAPDDAVVDRVVSEREVATIFQ